MSATKPTAAERRENRRALLLALRLITGAALRADRLRFAVALLANATMSIGGILLALFIRDLTNDLVNHHVGRMPGHLVELLICMAIYFFLGSLGGSTLLRLCELAAHRAECDLAELMLGLPTLAAFEKPEALDRLQVLRQNRWALALTVQLGGQLVRTVSTLITATVLLAGVSPVLILLPIAAVPSLVLGPLASSRQNRWADRNAASMRRRNAAFDLTTSPAAACEIRTFGMGPSLHTEYVALEEHLFIEGRSMGDRAALMVAAGQIFPVIAYSLALVTTIHALRHGTASVGDISLVVTVAATIQDGMSQLGQVLTQSTITTATTRRLAWLFTYARSVTAIGATLIPPASLRNGISLRDVGFDYTDGTSALDGVTIDLPPGSTVALVGENGAGKSTLVKLLLGLYVPTRGQILIDGTDLATIDPALWRSSCAGSFQDHVRLKFQAGTSVGLGELGFLEDEAAIAAAGVRGGATDVLDGLSSGLHTQLGKEFEGGTDLSGGQWQKLALARGMMRTEPLLLVLDEPTSALDPMTEAALFESYAEHARSTGARTGAITVLVSHRFSTVRNADLVMVVEGGRLVEVGNHAELMARGGNYAQLYELQAASYR